MFSLKGGDPNQVILITYGTCKDVSRLYQDHSNSHSTVDFILEKPYFWRVN